MAHSRLETYKMLRHDKKRFWLELTFGFEIDVVVMEVVEADDTLWMGLSLGLPLLLLGSLLLLLISMLSVPMSPATGLSH